MTTADQLALFHVKPQGTDFLDMRHAARALAREDAELRAGPLGRRCECPRPWPGDGGECVKCGRLTR